jgi:superfamily II DNA helicase RecQ
VARPAAGQLRGSSAGLPRQSAVALAQGSVANAAPTNELARAHAPVDEDCFERLRVWRMARSEGLPAFRVASNAVLAEIVRTRPANAEQLLAVRGVGPTFCAKHGQSLLAELRRLPAGTGR